MYIDIEQIINDLQHEIFDNGKKSLLSNNITINNNNVYAIIERLREAIPPALMEANNIIKDKERMYAECKKDIDNMMDEAENQVKRMLSDNNIINEAKKYSDQIVSDARDYAQQYETEAKRRIDEILAHCEKTVYDAFNIITNSRKDLNSPDNRRPNNNNNARIDNTRIDNTRIDNQRNDNQRNDNQRYDNQRLNNQK
jgi:vacuolar-type H+-ATPase subunit H